MRLYHEFLILRIPFPEISTGDLPETIPEIPSPVFSEFLEGVSLSSKINQEWQIFDISPETSKAHPKVPSVFYREVVSEIPPGAPSGILSWIPSRFIQEFQELFFWDLTKCSL